MKLFHLYGLERSGTNFLRCLLEHSCIAKRAPHGVDKGYWKHGEIECRVEHGLFIVKDPFGWLLSFHRYMKKKWREQTPADFSEFIRRAQNFQHIPPPGNVSVRKKWLSPPDHWNKMNLHWHDRLPVAVKYEDLLSDSMPMQIDMIRQEFDFEPLNPPRQIPQELGPEKLQRGIGKFDYHRRQYYLDRQYMSHIKSSDVDHIKRIIDSNLAASLGYDL